MLIDLSKVFAALKQANEEIRSVDEEIARLSEVQSDDGSKSRPDAASRRIIHFKDLPRESQP